MRVAAKRNRLLAALPEAALRRWLPRMQAVEFKLGQVLSGPGEALHHAWFPTTAVVSMLYGAEGGEPAEVALVGREGLVGLPIFMGGTPPTGAAVVQVAGWGFRLDAEAMKDSCDRDAPVLALLLRYTQSLLTQVAQTALCYRRHSLEQQLCRLLLQCLDRGADEDDALSLTHERMARMLGVRRGGVTEAATALQNAGAIRYARGRIRVLDRSRLEARSCACYAVIEGECERVFAPALAG